MSIQIRWLMSVFLLFFYNYSVASEMVVYIENDEGVVTSWAKPTVKLLPSYLLESSDMKSSNGWVYKVQIGQKLVTPILIDVSGKVPSNLSLDPIYFSPPFYADNENFIIKLAPVENKGGARLVRELYGTNVSDTLSDEDLPVFYQKARAAALARMKRLNENWRKLHSYDVQAVFKYLEIVREMNERTYILPPQDVDKANNWLKRAIDNKKSRVDKAVGFTNADQLVKQTERNQAVRFGNLWKYIANQSMCKDRYPLLVSYENMLRNVTAKKSREIIKKETGVYMANVLSAMSQCLSVEIRCYKKDGALEQIENMLEKLHMELQVTFMDNLKSVLKGLLAILSGILPESLPTSRPLAEQGKVDGWQRHTLAWPRHPAALAA